MQQVPYTLTELIQSDDFSEWVLRPNEANEARWQAYLRTFPEKRGVVEDAKGYVILLAVDTGKHKPSQEQSDRMWQMVQGKMSDEKEETPQPTAPRPLWKSWQIAASVALLVSIGTAGYWYYRTGGNPLQEMSNTQAQVTPALTRKSNTTSQPMTILLPDGSSVVLSPGSTLSYAATPTKGSRKVTLEGRAFFEIVKNPAQPFYVFTDGLTTRVLGTSFIVDARQGNEGIRVEVKTGKVSVFPASPGNLLTDDDDPTEEAVEKGIVLVQDQKITISRKSGKTIDAPLPTPDAAGFTDIAEQSFTFDETPVSKVFATLEKAYNVTISYDQDRMGDCPLNADLNGQPFHKKLSVICSALGAQFDIREDQVVISGNGCK
jgi:transmembrane sensor